MTAVAEAPPGPLTLDERIARGKVARARSPRGESGAWTPAASRPDPVAVLEGQAETRVPELIPIRYGRMLGSPFAFYRGAAAIMAADLAGTPDTGITAQLCGDAHLMNFGVYAAPDRRLVFDLNDFDETHRGPWEWDVRRLVASLEVAARDRGFKARRRLAIVRSGAQAYRKTMRALASLGHLAVWYSRVDVDEYLARSEREMGAPHVEAARRTVDKARRKDSLRAIEKLTTRVDGRLRFVSDPPLLVRLDDLLGDAGAEDMEVALEDLLERYRQSLAPHVRRLVSSFRVVDVARKVVGVGSVGTRAWVVLLEGRDERDPLVLQAKEACASVLEPHLEPGPYEHHGERVVHGQRFMQAASDPMLGWHRGSGIDGRERDFYVRQLWDGKGSAQVDTMPPERMEAYARLCGSTLARAHARSGDRVAIAAYLGSGPAFDRAMVEFAAAYADQNELDFAALEAAVDAGRLPAAASL